MCHRWVAHIYATRRLLWRSCARSWCSMRARGGLGGADRGERLEEWFANDVELDPAAGRRGRLPLGERRGASRDGRGGRGGAAARAALGGRAARSSSTLEEVDEGTRVDVVATSSPVVGPALELHAPALAFCARLDVFAALGRPEQAVRASRRSPSAAGDGHRARGRASRDPPGGREAPCRARRGRARRAVARGPRDPLPPDARAARRGDGAGSRESVRSGTSGGAALRENVVRRS